jgi:hypothetical protein
MQMYIAFYIRQLLCRMSEAGQSTGFCSRLTSCCMQSWTIRDASVSNNEMIANQLFVIFTKTPTDVQPDAEGTVAQQTFM